LLRRAEFERLQKGDADAKKAHAAHFTVLVAPRAGESHARLGIIASRRVGSAPRRNRAKRLVREYFRSIAAELGGIDIVVVVKTGAELLTLGEAARELSSAIAKARGKK
jgi:ribonuclease P protein component